MKLLSIRYNVDAKELPEKAPDDLAFAKTVLTSEEEDVEQTEGLMQVKKKEVLPINSVTYYVKRCTTGMDAGHLLNPNSIWHKGGETKAFDARTGRNYYRYEKVNENCFKLYLRFLETKNPAYLRNAEREIQ